MGLFDGLLDDGSSGNSGTYFNNMGGGYSVGNQGGFGYGNQNGQASLYGNSNSGMQGSNNSLLGSFGKNPLGTLGQMIPALMYSQNQNKYTQQQGNILNAMSNPQSQMYQNIYQQNRQQGQQALGNEIQQLSDANRKLSAMGRTPLFDSQRGGEQLFRGITQGNEANQNSAAQQTIGQLEQAYNAANTLGTRQQQGGLTGAQGLSGLGGIIGTMLGKSGGLAGLFG